MFSLSLSGWKTSSPSIIALGRKYTLPRFVVSRPTNGDIGFFLMTLYTLSHFNREQHTTPLTDKSPLVFHLSHQLLFTFVFGGGFFLFSKSTNDRDKYCSWLFHISHLSCEPLKAGEKKTKERFYRFRYLFHHHKRKAYDGTHSPLYTRWRSVRWKSHEMMEKPSLSTI